MRAARPWLGIAMVMVLACCLMLACGSKEPTPRERLKAVMAELAAEDYDKVFGRFDPKLRQTLSKERLIKNWNALLRTRGSYKECVVSSGKELGNVHAIHATCAFERGTVLVNATINADGTLRTFSFLPSAQ